MSGKQIISLLARFGKDRSGNVAILFGLALVPALGLAGDDCTAAKATGAQVYTVRVVAGNANLLRNCATKTDMYCDVKDAAGIGPVIEEIAHQISQIRLTS